MTTKKFLNSLGIAPTELSLLNIVSPRKILSTLTGTGLFEQDNWNLPTGETISYEIIDWSADANDNADKNKASRGSWLDHRDQIDDEDDEEDRVEEVEEFANASVSLQMPLLDNLPASCLSRVAAYLSLTDLARVCTVSTAFRRLCGVKSATVADKGAIDTCWVDRIRRHFGEHHLRNCWPNVCLDTCCGDNPFARLYLQALLGLYRARPVELDDQTPTQLQLSEPRLVRLLPESSLGGALFSSPVLSPILLSRPLMMEFQFFGVHLGRYDLLLRVKKLICEPLDSDYVASAADSSGVRVPLIQARINRRSVTVSNFECSVDVTADSPKENGVSQQPLLSTSTMSHLLQNYSLQPDRWFYWRLATLELTQEKTGVTNLIARVSVMRRGVADATVTQEEFERELRNALLIDHLFLRPLPWHPTFVRNQL